MLGKDNWENQEKENMDWVLDDMEIFFYVVKLIMAWWLLKILLSPRGYTKVHTNLGI